MLETIWVLFTLFDCPWGQIWSLLAVAQRNNLSHEEHDRLQTCSLSSRAGILSLQCMQTVHLWCLRSFEQQNCCQHRWHCCWSSTSIMSQKQCQHLPRWLFLMWAIILSLRQYALGQNGQKTLAVDDDRLFIFGTNWGSINIKIM